MQFGSPSNVQDTCDDIFTTKAGLDRLSLTVKITMYLLGRPCPESEKSSSQKYGLAIVDVETLVFHHKDLWITLWLECMDEGGIMHHRLCQGIQHKDVTKQCTSSTSASGISLLSVKHGDQCCPHVSQRSMFPMHSCVCPQRVWKRMLAPHSQEMSPSYLVC